MTSALLQSMTGEGVLQWIDDTELNSWAQTAAVRAAVAALAGGDAALATFQQGGAAATQPAPFQVRDQAAGVIRLKHLQLMYGQHLLAHHEHTGWWRPTQLIGCSVPHSLVGWHWHSSTATLLLLAALLQCRTELGVLPNDHPQRTDAVLRRCGALLPFVHDQHAAFSAAAVCVGIAGCCQYGFLHSVRWELQPLLPAIARQQMTHSRPAKPNMQGDRKRGERRQRGSGEAAGGPA